MSMSSKKRYLRKKLLVAKKLVTMETFCFLGIFFSLKKKKSEINTISVIDADVHVSVPLRQVLHN